MKPFLATYEERSINRRIVFAENYDDVDDRLGATDNIQLPDGYADDNGPIEVEELETFIVDAATCPQCGSRTEYEPIGQTKSDLHERMGYKCGYKFIGVDE